MAAAEQARLANATRRVHLLQDRMMRQGLQRRVAQANARCQNLATRMDAAARRTSARARAHLQQLHAQLQALSPTAILDRGYALVYDAQGSLLRNSSLIVAGQAVTTRLAQGSFRSAVIETIPREQDAE